MENASDEAFNDINAFASRGETKAILSLPCNVTITDSLSTADSIKITLTFNGNNCANTRSRTGQIEYSKKIGEHWKDAGTGLVVKFMTYKVTKLSNNKSIIINGKKVFRNISGGLIINLGTTATSVTHKVEGNLQVTFDDNTTREWNVRRQKTFTGTFPTDLVLTVDGFGSADGYTNLVNWGTNRHGELFYTSIDQSVVFKQSCNFDPVSGIIVHQIPNVNKKATITFGYDDNNQLVSGNNCPTRYKLDWEVNGNSGTIFIQM